MADEVEFEMEPVTSANIESVGFNAEAKQIKIRFMKSGSEYIYEGCTEAEYDEILNAPSANDAFTGLLKNVKPYRRVS